MQHWLPASAEVRADLLHFTPVARNKRAGGWTAERQRAFVAALAETGSVKAAARRVNMSAVGAYVLRRRPDAESFAAAWDAAQASGVQSLGDIAMDRAVEGVPVPVFYRGEQVGERRSYNDRLLMFLIKQSGKGGVRMGALDPAPVTPRESEEERRAGLLEGVAVWLDQVFGRYVAKVRAERRHRLAGEVAAADFTLRQLTHIELILDIGGRSQELIRFYTGEESPNGSGRLEHNASPIGELLDERRREIWAEAGDPPRPALPLGKEVRRSGLHGGDTRPERETAQREAEATIAAAQAKWEAAATEEGWARYGEGGEERRLE